MVSRIQSHTNWQGLHLEDIKVAEVDVTCCASWQCQSRHNEETYPFDEGGDGSDTTQYFDFGSVHVIAGSFAA